MWVETLLCNLPTTSVEKYNNKPKINLKADFGSLGSCVNEDLKIK